MRSLRQAGLSLIELMVAMVLGLVVVGGALNIFLSNRQTYRATENLGRIQENARVAFELMSRDLRQAGGNPCDKGLPVVNVVNNPTSQWWTNFGIALIGYDGDMAFPDASFGTGPGERVAGTDAIQLHSALDGVVNVSFTPGGTPAALHLNTTNHGISIGDIVAVCDFDHVAITQVTNSNPGTNATIRHQTGTGTPGNCVNGLGKPPGCGTSGQCIPASCTPATGTAYPFGPNSKVARMQATRWYIGNSRTGNGTSLYQVAIRNNGGTPQPVAQEIADGVQDMQLEYFQQGDDRYRPASASTDWARVVAVRVRLTLVGPEAVDGQPLERDFEHVVTLRNRL